MMSMMILTACGGAQTLYTFIEGYRKAADMRKDPDFRETVFEYFPGRPETFRLEGIWQGCKVWFIGSKREA